MKNVYYRSAFTDAHCLMACDHQHPTVSAAVACISAAGGYVVGVEDGALRTLTDAEEAEFQTAMYGTAGVGAKTLKWPYITRFLETIP